MSREKKALNKTVLSVLVFFFSNKCCEQGCKRFKRKSFLSGEKILGNQVVSRAGHNTGCKTLTENNCLKSMK